MEIHDCHPKEICKLPIDEPQLNAEQFQPADQERKGIQSLGNQPRDDKRHHKGESNVKCLPRK